MTGKKLIFVKKAVRNRQYRTGTTGVAVPSMTRWYILNKNYSMMDSKAKSVVERMFAAFSKGDVEAFVQTVSPDTVWIYHGTRIIPKGMWKGVEGVRKFVTISSVTRKS